MNINICRNMDGIKMSNKSDWMAIVSLFLGLFSKCLGVVHAGGGLRDGVSRSLGEREFSSEDRQIRPRCQRRGLVVTSRHQKRKGKA